MSAGDSPSNTRRYPRLICFLAVELRVEGTESPVVGNLASISLGGCGVETETPVEFRSRVEISLLFGHDRVVTRGAVVNRRLLNDKPGFGIGIRFADTREQVTEFVKFVERTTQIDDQQYWYLRQLGDRQEKY